MKSLQTLIKLQKTRVDEQRLILARLQERKEQIEKQIEDLEAQKRRESVAAGEHVEGRLTYGAFLGAAVRTGRDLDKQRRAAEAAVEAARTILTDLFAEQKRYEIADAARVSDEEHEEKRRSTIEFDEIGSVHHARKDS